MSAPGEFTALRRDGEHVVKALAPDHPAGARFVAAMLATGRNGVQRYITTLREGGVVLPADLEVIENTEAIAVRHCWIRGRSLLEMAAEAPSVFVDAISTIGTWVAHLATADARLDTNLANFYLDGDRLVTVDVLPPLIPSCCPVARDLFDTLFFALCFQTPVTQSALVGYAARKLLTHPDPAAARGLTALASTLCPELEHRPELEHLSTEKFPATWFSARAVLALRALQGQVSTDVAMEFFAWTSVLAFRGFDEKQRAERIGQVRVRMTELGLR